MTIPINDSSITTETRIPEFQDISKIPSLISPIALRTLTFTRIKQLKKAASRNWDSPPPPPTPSDCCGSSCSPCVKDLWKEELQAWKERWGRNGVGLGKDGKVLEIQVLQDEPLHGDGDQTETRNQDENGIDFGVEGKEGGKDQKSGSLENQNQTENKMPGAFLLDW